MARPPDPNASDLPPGLYERVVDRRVERLLGLLPARGREAEILPLDPGEAHAVLADHLRAAVREALESMAGADRLASQVALSDRILSLLGVEPGDDARLAPPPRRLLSVWPSRAHAERPGRPDTPLGAGCLFWGTRLDPSLVSQLRKELASADRVEILCSFIKWSGIRILQDELRGFTARPGTRLRVLTTSYLGATDLKAVEFLAALPNTELKVSYDTQRTRLHAKAYLFQRASGFGTAYIGSANLSRPALTEGLEWTVKVSQHESPVLWGRVAGTFETYWQDGEFLAYGATDRERLRLALESERGGTDESEAGAFFFDLRPHEFQREILERLEAERVLQGRHRHLVVAATGTGKTIIAAFDYRAWCRTLERDATPGEFRRPRLMFVAHREELLDQALRTFRAVLRDPNFGDLLVGGRSPEQLDHLFVSIQSYRSRSLHERPADFYDYIVVDEFHHAAAPSYRLLLDHVRPRVLLGLTATPERSDGLDVLRYFDGHASAQVRLPDAINRKLLSPFQYFAVTDDVDLDGLQWHRGGYRVEQLDRVYTGNDRRASLVVGKVRSILLDTRRARGLGFCVSVAHARFMADQFNRHGIAASSLSSETPQADRLEAQARLRRREVNFLFVVDLYNEGVDIPEIDTVLFLRPTESLTVFLQQLGRGLRLFEEKECLTVLDFIGRAHRSFRFDLRYRALMTDSSISLAGQVEGGFTGLPAGCTILMERVARQHILENIRQALRQTRDTLVRDLEALGLALGRRPSLGEFLERTGTDPDALYRRGVSYSRLCAEAGLVSGLDEPDERPLTRGFRRLAHTADPTQIGFLLGWLRSAEAGATGPAVSPSSFEERWLLMMDLCLWGRQHLPLSVDDGRARLARNPALRDELRDLLAYRLGCIDSVAPPHALPFRCALSLHAPYTRDEILAGLGHWTRSSQREMREGVLHLPDLAADAFFFTLHKAEAHYSPTTMYQDYAISERLFHWQSQSTTSAESPTGLRYIEHESRGHAVLLFGREHRSKNQMAQPFVFLGSARYVSHTGSRPMSVTWELLHPLPARLYRTLARYAVA